jgi:hypothetical protein
MLCDLWMCVEQLELEKVNGEMALIMTVYNMKRAINILGIEKLLEKLKNWKPKSPAFLKSNKKHLFLRLCDNFRILNYKSVA